MFILDDDELQRLTGKQQNNAMLKQLRQMGVRHAQRLDGWPIVTKDAVLEYTGVTLGAPVEARATLNLSARGG